MCRIGFLKGKKWRLHSEKINDLGLLIVYINCFYLEKKPIKFTGQDKRHGCRLTLYTNYNEITNLHYI